MELQAASNGICTFPVRLQGDDQSLRAALGRAGDEIVLVAAEQSVRARRESPSAPIARLSVLVAEDPFPGLTMDGRQMIWVKDYSENAGLLEQLEEAGALRRTGSTIPQGLVRLPLAVVVLNEREMAQRCALEGCDEVESVETTERYKRCSSCSRRYYCSTEHQHAHWPRHKQDCKDLAAGRFTQVEMRRRAQDELPPREHE
ncbi:hypothetical protein JCM3775_004719 [Rhodotorula graminis]|uniref:MYND-type domain-containing protein n=1 Tax=Rhodotorula graminis (strain WP1) TaxID=578459 RepID=A0A194S9B5_RHOGW|nr:uncharacterized protein RHOBADRAFT_66128 [Rhodotorula graminis WP1]KPV77060.1 hypothetical protein RHOBADRAFT_66128 [Rhodotorula graminis WP1]